LAEDRGFDAHDRRKSEQGISFESLVRDLKKRAEYRLLIKPSPRRKSRRSNQERTSAGRGRIRPLAEDRAPRAARSCRSRRTLPVRQGAYRIVYTIDDATRTVEIIKVGHRREVYRSAR